MAATVTRPLHPNPSAGPNLRRVRTRRSLVAMAGATFAERGPGALSWAREAAARVRTAALTLGGLTLITAAAWEVDSALGKVTAGVGLLTVEYLTGAGPEDES